MNQSKNELTIEQVLEYLIQKVNQLEIEVESLKIPQLMYKRPGSSKHEKIAEFLNDVERRLKELEG